jgi:hypothetical protein
MFNQQEYKFPSHLDNLLASETTKTDDPSKYIQQRVPMQPYLARTYAELSGFQRFN